MLRIFDAKQFKFLPARPVNKIVYFSGCTGIQPADKIPIFSGAQIIIFSSCDRSFIHSCLYPKHFPNIISIYTNSHGGSEVYRFSNVKVYVTDSVYDTNIVLQNWNKSDAFIKILDKDHFELLDKLADRE